MSTKLTGNKARYTRYSAEYKQESLKLATQIGVAKAAKQLELWNYMNPNPMLGAKTLNVPRASANGSRSNPGNGKYPIETPTSPTG